MKIETKSRILAVENMREKKLIHLQVTPSKYCCVIYSVIELEMCLRCIELKIIRENCTSSDSICINFFHFKLFFFL